MYKEHEVAAAYYAAMTDFWGEEDIYDDNDQLRARIEAGRALLAHARLVLGKPVMSGNPVPEIDADGETIVVSVGYTATTEFFRRVGLRRVDDLVSILECADLVGVTQQAVSQALDSGRLHAFVQPTAGRRQRRRLVSLSEAKKVW